MKSTPRIQDGFKGLGRLQTDTPSRFESLKPPKQSDAYTKMTMTESQVDFEVASSMLIRWRLAQACLANINMGPMIEARALQILVEQDIPRMLSELFRLRPKLQTELQTAIDETPVMHFTSVFYSSAS
jgi:hypothetical protein